MSTPKKKRSKVGGRVSDVNNDTGILRSFDQSRYGNPHQPTVLDGRNKFTFLVSGCGRVWTWLKQALLPAHPPLTQSIVITLLLLLDMNWKKGPGLVMSGGSQFHLARFVRLHSSGSPLKSTLEPPPGATRSYFYRDAPTIRVSAPMCLYLTLSQRKDLCLHTRYDQGSARAPLTHGLLKDLNILDFHPTPKFDARKDC